MFMPPSEVTPSLLRGLFAEHADGLAVINGLLRLDPYLLDKQEAVTEALMPRPETRRPVDMMLQSIGRRGTIPTEPLARDELFRGVEWWDRDFRDGRSSLLPQEASFWLRTVADSIVPLLAHPETPEPTKLFLVDCVSTLCLSSTVPAEIGSDIYVAYAKACADLGVAPGAADQLKVLVSNDIEELPRYFMRCFEEYLNSKGVPAGFVSVFGAEGGDGLVTLNMLLEERFSVLVTDIQKPGIDGVELVRRYRQTAEPHRACPVVMFTGYHLPVFGEECQRAGASAYISIEPWGFDRVVRFVLGYGARDPVHIGALGQSVRCPRHPKRA